MTSSLRPVIIFAGGPIEQFDTRDLPPNAYVIAADSGYWHAKEMNMGVDLLVGDLDSIGDGAIEELLEVRDAPVMKDETDFELALQTARSLASEIVVVGALGGRLDHTLGNLAALCAPALRGLPITILGSSEEVHVVSRSIVLPGSPGQLLSLIPWAGPACGVTTSGLLYGLENEDLDATQARGVSNVFTASEAEIELRDGTLLVVRPRT